jgi:hypothetical protein
MTELTATERFVHKMSYYQGLGALQRQPDWLARFVLRPDYEEPEMPEDQRWLYDQGIRNYMTAAAWLRKWVTDGQADLPIFVMGSRDLCWQVSWLLEILEGRYADDIADGYESSYYLRSRYGTSLYSDMWSVDD